MFMFMFMLTNALNFNFYEGFEGFISFLGRWGLVRRPSVADFV